KGTPDRGRRSSAGRGAVGLPPRQAEPTCQGGAERAIGVPERGWAAFIWEIPAQRNLKGGTTNGQEQIPCRRRRRGGGGGSGIVPDRLHGWRKHEWRCRSDATVL